LPLSETGPLSLEMLLKLPEKLVVTVPVALGSL
jgi:hypothetical protein